MATAAVTGRVNLRYLVNSVIAVAIMAFFRFIPPFGSLTPLGMTLLGIFIGLIYAWICVDMVWPSVLGLAMVGFTSYAEGGVASVFTAVISNDVVQMLLWLLVFAAILTTSGISDQLAKRLVGSKLCKGRPWVLSVFIYLAALICSSFGSGFAVVLVCWSFVYSISKEVGYTKKDKWPRMMIVGVVIGCVLGLAGMPFQPAVVGAFGYLFAASGGTIQSFNYLEYIAFACLFFSVSSVLYFLLCRFIVNPDMSKLKKVVNVVAREPFDARQRIAIASLLLLFAFMVVPSLLPEGAAKGFLDNVGMTAFVLALAAGVSALRDGGGKPYFDFSLLCKEGIFWPMIFMIATAVYMGIALSSAGTGFNETVLAVFSPLLANSNPFLFCLMVSLIALVLTNFLSNAVTSAITVPVVYPFAVALGINPIVPVVLIIYATEMGLLLPCSSPSAAMLYGNETWLTAKDIVQQGSIGILAAALALLVCIQPAMALFTLP